MEVPMSILEAINEVMSELDSDYCFDCSHISFFCNEAERSEAAACFRNAFLQPDEDGHVGKCRTEMTDNGFVAYCDDTYFDDEANDLGIIPYVDGDPRGRAIQAVKNKCPGIRYRGLDCGCQSDRWGGDIVWDEYGEGMPAPLTYDSVGKALSDALSEGDFFWNCLSYSLEDEDEFSEVMACFQVYAKYIKDDTVERLLKLAEEKSPAIREALEGEAF